MLFCFLPTGFAAGAAFGWQEAANDETAGTEEADAVVKKRRYSRRGGGRALLRQPSSDEVLLYPHDASGALMKELAHEAGAKWVLNGSPGRERMNLSSPSVSADDQGDHPSFLRDPRQFVKSKSRSLSDVLPLFFLSIPDPPHPKSVHFRARCLRVVRPACATE